MTKVVMAERVHPHPLGLPTVRLVQRVPVVVVLLVIVAGRGRLEQGQPQIQVLLVRGDADEPVQMLDDLAEGGPLLGPVVPALAHEQVAGGGLEDR